MKSNLFLFGAILFLIFQPTIFEAQSKMKLIPSENEKHYLTDLFLEISKSDQLYRNMLSKGTMDSELLTKIDSVYDANGVKAGLSYEATLNLELDEAIEDSLWRLQHQLDFKNHMLLKGVFNTYGYISEELVKEKNFVQILLLMHPPKDWDIRTYHKIYSDILIDEVKEDRMPAKVFAMFYDNILAKILREPQLYGTNQQFNPETKEIMPPIIKDLAESNKARSEIGMPLLGEGEYRLAEK